MCSDLYLIKTNLEGEWGEDCIYVKMYGIFDHALWTNGEVFEFRDKTVCDDCYIDLMIGIPEIDISGLPPEIQCNFIKIKQGWNRDRPNRHHYLKFNPAG